MMNVKICNLLVAVFSAQLAVSLCYEFCPKIAATFTAMVDQTVDDPLFLVEDPEQTFFKDVMNFRDDEIENTLQDAFKFYNDTYGLNFSQSLPNQFNVHVFENAVLSPARFAEEVRYQLAYNNWIQTGNTRTTCRDIFAGGFLVAFTGEQVLHGSYGGADGIPVGGFNSLIYGFGLSYLCPQSPFIIQFQTATPVRLEPVDGSGFYNFDVYNNVLGHGRAPGVAYTTPDPDHPGKYRLVIRIVHTFPAK